MKYSLRSLPPLSPPDGIDGVADKPRRRWYQFSLLTSAGAITTLCVMLAAYGIVSRLKRKLDRQVDEALGVALEKVVEKMGEELPNIKIDPSPPQPHRSP